MNYNNKSQEYISENHMTETESKQGSEERGELTNKFWRPNFHDYLISLHPKIQNHQIVDTKGTN